MNTTEDTYVQPEPISSASDPSEWGEWEGGTYDPTADDLPADVKTAIDAEINRMRGFTPTLVGGQPIWANRAQRRQVIRDSRNAMKRERQKAAGRRFR